MHMRTLGSIGLAVLSAMVLTAIALTGCGSSGGSSGGSSSVRVAMAADYSGSTRLPSVSRPVASSCPAGGSATDEPAFQPGDDCDLDGGTVAFLTPAHFTVALKRFTLVTDAGESVDVVPDSGTLAEATRFDLTNAVTLSQDAIPIANYVEARAEIYYFEITMPLNNDQAEQTIRVYLSDDDFPAEGNLHHHQGDITLVDDAGTELGWVGVNSAWTAAALQTDPDTVVRPGAVDAETGHQRGHFGNGLLWDQAEFDQGANQDVFILTVPISVNMTNLDAPTVTFTFDVTNSWFWEDFDADTYFDPCQDVNGDGESDACVANAEWAPLFNPPAVSVE